MSKPPPAHTDATYTSYHEQHVSFWDSTAQATDGWSGMGGYYHRRLAHVYKLVIPKGSRVLEVGCGRGALLAAVEPSVGVGIDFSVNMIERAQKRHPHLRFIVADAHDIPLSETFDYIILSDLANEVWDVQQVLEQLRPLCNPRTKIILNSYSRLWEWPLSVAGKLNLAKPMLKQNWLTPGDLENLLGLAGFEPMRRWQEVVWPLSTPLIGSFCNRVLARLTPFKHLALSNMIIARPKPDPVAAGNPTVSVIVAARNEAGHIDDILSRTPEFGGGVELIFVEGGSSDNTYEVIEQKIAEHPDKNYKLFRQTGKGKGDAVRLGFAEATGDVLMILDADLTVPPEDLPRFYEALRSGTGEFINGVRLVYPMQDKAMRFANLIANKFFGLAFSWLLGQPIKDSLCGTKVMWRQDYEVLAANRAYFGDFDPFGDFDLIFGAAKLNLKIVDMPVRYRERVYGETNISRWSGGVLLLRMVIFAARRIKFV
jgi:SAM-dependent methyltransferase